MSGLNATMPSDKHSGYQSTFREGKMFQKYIVTHVLSLIQVVLELNATALQSHVK